MWTARLVSLAAGSASVPLLGLLAAALFGRPAGLLAALLLACLPMHVALSATSLSDAPSIAALLAALWATLRLGRQPRDPSAWAALLLGGLAGTAMRFDFWLVLPFLALHHLLARRSLAAAIPFGLALSPFPACWLAATLSQGGIEAAYAKALSGAAFVGASPYGAPRAAWSFLATLDALTGPPLILATMVGLPLCLRAGFARQRLGALLLSALLAGETAFMLKWAADRGAALWPRYLLTEALLAIPFAALALARLPGGAASRAGVVAVAVAAMPLSTFAARTDLYLARAVPADIAAAAAWLAARPGDEALVLTRMGWRSSYIPPLDRLAPERYRIVSDWIGDAELADFAAERRPAVLVTAPGDRDLVERLARATHLLPMPPPLARFGDVLLFRLEPAGRPPRAGSPAP